MHYDDGKTESKAGHQRRNTKKSEISNAVVPLCLALLSLPLFCFDIDFEITGRLVLGFPSKGAVPGIFSLLCK